MTHLVKQNDTHEPVKLLQDGVEDNLMFQFEEVLVGIRLHEHRVDTQSIFARLAEPDSNVWVQLAFKIGFIVHLEDLIGRPDRSIEFNATSHRNYRGWRSLEVCRDQPL